MCIDRQKLGTGIYLDKYQFNPLGTDIAPC